MRRAAGGGRAAACCSVCAAAAAAAGAAPPGAMLASYPLTGVDPGAVCLNGAPPSVQAWVNPRPSTTWVILLGNPVAANIAGALCINDNTCAEFARPSAPAPPPDPVPTLGGIQSQNCSVNPQFCAANQAAIPACDFSFFLGEGATARIPCGAGEPHCNGTQTARFAGRRTIAAAVKRLATLGLSAAEEVLVYGVTFGGTSLILNADYIGGQLRAAAPGLKKYKAMPVDGIHPQYGTMICIPPPQSCNAAHGDTWLTPALRYIEGIPGATAGLSKDCVAQHPDSPWQCLYAAEALRHVQTPLFAVQQMPGVWDYQCQFEGQPWGPEIVDSMECSLKNALTMNLHTCTQYVDYCPPQYVANYTVPLQQAYLDVATGSGLAARAGSGGFFFGCYLGSYIHEAYGTTDPANFPRAHDAMWNQVAVGGVTMRAAVAEWWALPPGAASARWHADSLWNASGTPPAPGAAAAARSDAPVVPWWVNRFFTNPTCRGYPWY